MHNRPALTRTQTLGYSARSLPTSMPLGGFAGNKRVLRGLSVTFCFDEFSGVFCPGTRD